MRYLSLSEMLQLHRRLVDQSGGTCGILDLGQLESALRQPLSVLYAPILARLCRSVSGR